MDAAKRLGSHRVGSRRGCQGLRGTSGSPRRLRSRSLKGSASASMITAIHRLLVWVVLLPVIVYRRVLSPLKRMPSCRYLPTCSEYATDAVRERGIFVGVALAVWRLLRCNPLFRGGYDPVPCAAHRKEH